MDFNFVLCHRFHGATVLALLLNNHTEISCLGDQFPRSDRRHVCGCGVDVNACEFWRLVESRYGTLKANRAPTMYPIYPRLCRNFKLNEKLVETTALASLASGPFLWRLFGRQADTFIKFYLDFVTTVNEFNGTSVYVNGRKSILSALAIRSILGEEARLNVIHLFRDPRGFCASERRVDPHLGVAVTARRWKTYHNRVIRILNPLCKARYVSIRYEDLCARPEETMAKIFEFLGVGYQDVLFAPGVHHTLGNQSMRRFDGTLHQSLKWCERLTPEEQEKVLAVTRPLSATMGYTRSTSEAKVSSPASARPRPSPPPAGSRR